MSESFSLGVTWHLSSPLLKITQEYQSEELIILPAPLLQAIWNSGPCPLPPGSAIFILFLFKVFSDRISAKDCESCVEGEEDVISPDKKELSGVEKVKWKHTVGKSLARFPNWLISPEVVVGEPD